MHATRLRQPTPRISRRPPAPDTRRAAAGAAGKTLGRPVALDEDKAFHVVDAYAEGAAVKALARRYDVAPKTIRRVLDAADARAVGDVLEELNGVAANVEDQEQAPHQPLSIDVAGLLADHLQGTRAAPAP